MKRLGFTIALLLTGIFVFSCDSNQSAGTDKKSRWYTTAQVQTGKTVFLKNCAECHGKKAQGTVSNWRKPLADRSYPPPPLNGTAHAYHHSLSELKKSIDMGGLSQSGKMPKFKDKLNEDEKLAAIAYFQSFWSDAVYRKWLKMGGTK